jgi:uncharacterized membrane protein YpjA
MRQCTRNATIKRVFGMLSSVKFGLWKVHVEIIVGHDQGKWKVKLFGDSTQNTVMWVIFLYFNLCQNVTQWTTLCTTIFTTQC